MIMVPHPTKRGDLWERWGWPLFQLIAWSVMAGIALFVASLLWRWFLNNPGERELWLTVILLYVGFPVVLVYVVVRVIRYAWKGD